MADATYVIVRRDGEDLTRLDPDPLRIVEPPAGSRRLAGMLVVAMLLTAGVALYVTWTVSRVVHSETSPGSESELGVALSLAGIFPAVAATAGAWFRYLREAVGRTGRADLVAAYGVLCAAEPSPRLGTVRGSTYDSNETSRAYRCAVTVRLADGTTLRAHEHRRLPARTADRAPTRYTPLQVPRFGDTVTVFTGPEAGGITVVQANHSWSALRKATGRR
ncbi:hypothetical protein BJF79_00240 [Actinomadura sp. CNU-125]|uniref:hypothetical protein n=1 Tax=Actinomadura sp. CNU-125 TaxID=1904961 RepID=UPI0009690E3B|nr:hypothetical protein [Actinomadura sp. CNU-125]OLT31676.1 hypothetical protein BJF79_00240 [Actinomadura sp. CNU-125]